MPPEQDLPEPQPTPESQQAPSEDLAPDRRPDTPLPTPAASICWLVVFFALFFIAAMIYIMGYGAILEFEYAAQGVSPPPQAEIEVAMQQHVFTLGGAAGIYILQFLLLIPILVFAAHFPGQPWTHTLGLRSFDGAALRYWLAILLAFLCIEYLLNQIIDIDPGEFIKVVSGSKHLLLSLVVVLLAPVLEELVFRGYLFQAWRNTRLGLSGTLLLTSAIFTSLHMGQYNAIILAMLFVLSIVLGLAREKTDSVWVPVILHSVNNLASVITIIYLGLV